MLKRKMALDDQHSLICWSNNIALFTYNYDISTYLVKISRHLWNKCGVSSNPNLQPSATTE